MPRHDSSTQLGGLVFLFLLISTSAFQISRFVVTRTKYPPSPKTTILQFDMTNDLSLANKDVVVFIAGITPFAWATVEFWRRIAVGEPFGTGTDSVYIGKDNAPNQSRGRQTLDSGAFLVAYVLFGIAAGVIGLTLYSVMSSTTLDTMPSSMITNVGIIIGE